MPAVMTPRWQQRASPVNTTLAGGHDRILVMTGGVTAVVTAEYTAVERGTFFVLPE